MYSCVVAMAQFGARAVGVAGARPRGMALERTGGAVRPGRRGGGVCGCRWRRERSRELKGSPPPPRADAVADSVYRARSTPNRFPGGDAHGERRVRSRRPAVRNVGEDEVRALVAAAGGTFGGSGKDASGERSEGPLRSVGGRVGARTFLRRRTSDAGRAAAGCPCPITSPRTGACGRGGDDDDGGQRRPGSRCTTCRSIRRRRRRRSRGGRRGGRRPQLREARRLPRGRSPPLTPRPSSAATAPARQSGRPR